MGHERGQMSTIIIGRGPTGLAAGIELRRLGLACKIYERGATGSGRSRVVGILPNSLDLLATAGALKYLSPAAADQLARGGAISFACLIAPLRAPKGRLVIKSTGFCASARPF